MKGYYFLREQCIVEQMEFHFVQKRGMLLVRRARRWGHFIVNEIYRVEGCYNCNLQIFLCLFLEKLNMPLNTPVTKALQVRFSFLL